MKQLCLIFALLLSFTSLLSQNLNDSVIVYVDNRVELTIATYDYANLKTTNTVIEALEQFLGVLPGIEGQLSSSIAEVVKFSASGTLTIEPGEDKVTYLIKDGLASNTGVRDKVSISGDGFEIFITTTDLPKLQELPLTKCLNKIFNMLPEKSKWSKSLYYQCINEEVLELESKHRTGKLDYLEFNLGAGGGLVKNNWVADLSFQVVLGLVEKGVPKHRPYLSTNVLFDFNENGNENGNIDLNMFLNIGYRPTIVKDVKKSTWLGVEIGYLIINQGDLFEDNTFRLGVNWSPLKGVFVGPQLYATDNFNKVFPGIRLGFGI